MIPSQVLGYSMFPAEAFGVDYEKLDTEPNLITHTIQDAKRILHRAGIITRVEGSPDYEDYASAWAKVTLSLLIRHFAVNKASFSGIQRGPTGSTETPLGSLEEMLAAAAEYYAQAKAIYPDALWPLVDFNRDAGNFPLRRDSAGYWGLKWTNLSR